MTRDLTLQTLRPGRVGKGSGSMWVMGVCREGGGGLLGGLGCLADTLPFGLDLTVGNHSLSAYIVCI